MHTMSMTRSVRFAPEERYHLYNRGTEKRTIFVSEKDYRRFLGLLYLCNTSQPVMAGASRFSLKDYLTVDRPDTLVSIGAYCLMPNHFHLLVHESKENGISKFMQKLITAYTMYFNLKYERSGALFQGKFKAVHADSDEYLTYLYAYIHLNPLTLFEPQWKQVPVANTQNALDFLSTYPYSSYSEYAGAPRTEAKILSREVFPHDFSPGEFDALIADWIVRMDSETPHKLS